MNMVVADQEETFFVQTKEFATKKKKNERWFHLPPCKPQRRIRETMITDHNPGLPHAHSKNTAEAL